MRSPAMLELEEGIGGPICNLQKVSGADCKLKFPTDVGLK